MKLCLLSAARLLSRQVKKSSVGKQQTTFFGVYINWMKF
jgi:hypothetical protein